MPDYGALSGRKLDEQRPGARVAVDAHKKSPLDFVLWKLFGWTEDAVYAKRDAASELCTCEASFLE